jgi:hypothetical protein
MHRRSTALFTYFSSPKLSKDFRNRRRLNASFQELVEFDRPRRQREHGFAVLEGVGCRLEIHRNKILDDFLELEDLGFRNALDVGKLADCSMSDLVRARKKANEQSCLGE